MGENRSHAPICTGIMCRSESRLVCAEIQYKPVFSGGYVQRIAGKEEGIGGVKII